MLMLALRLILKGNGGKQHCLIPFVGSNLGVEIFLKKREYLKKMRWGLRVEAHLDTLNWGFKKILCKICLLFNCFLVIKGIIKALISFIPWLLSFSDLPNYGSNSRKRYTLRLLSNEGPPNPSMPSLIPLDGLLLV